MTIIYLFYTQFIDKKKKKKKKNKEAKMLLLIRNSHVLHLVMLTSRSVSVNIIFCPYLKSHVTIGKKTRERV